jgi:hypothetical protein
VYDLDVSPFERCRRPGAWSRGRGLLERILVWESTGSDGQGEETETGKHGEKIYRGMRCTSRRVAR